MSLIRKFTSVTAIMAFIGSPTGQKVIGKAKEVVTDPANRAKAAEFVGKLRKPSSEAPPTP